MIDRVHWIIEYSGFTEGRVFILKWCFFKMFMDEPAPTIFIRAGIFHDNYFGYLTTICRYSIFCILCVRSASAQISLSKAFEYSFSSIYFSVFVADHPI
jgi:hypothetical protein